MITVTGDWCVSYSSLCSLFSSQSVVDADDGKTTLNVYQVDGGTVTRHPELDGLKFDSREAAQAFGVEHGVLFEWIQGHRGPDGEWVHGRKA